MPPATFATLEKNRRARIRAVGLPDPGTGPPSRGGEKIAPPMHRHCTAGPSTTGATGLSRAGRPLMTILNKWFQRVNRQADIFFTFVSSLGAPSKNTQGRSARARARLAFDVSRVPDKTGPARRPASDGHGPSPRTRPRPTERPAPVPPASFRRPDPIGRAGRRSPRRGDELERLTFALHLRERTPP